MRGYITRPTENEWPMLIGRQIGEAEHEGRRFTMHWLISGCVGVRDETTGAVWVLSPTEMMAMAIEEGLTERGK